MFGTVVVMVGSSTSNFFGPLQTAASLVGFIVCAPIIVAGRLEKPTRAQTHGIGSLDREVHYISVRTCQPSEYTDPAKTRGRAAHVAGAEMALKVPFREDVEQSETHDDSGDDGGCSPRVTDGDILRIVAREVYIAANTR